MLIESIKLNGLLSFSHSAQAIPLQPLNLIIGPNGSGKSNLIESIDLLKMVGEQEHLRFEGGISDWLFKGGDGNSIANIEILLNNPNGSQKLRYVLSFTENNQRLVMVDEKIENAEPFGSEKEPYFYYHFNHGQPVLNVNNEKRSLQREHVDLDESIISQRKDPDQYPEITYLEGVQNSVSLA